MSSFKPLSVLMCLLCLALPGFAEKPADNRPPADDSHSLEYKREMDPDYIPTQVGGKRLDEWIKDLKHPDPSIRENALIAIPQFKKGALQAVPDIVMVLHDSDASPRVKAAISLRMIPIERKSIHRSRVMKGLSYSIAHDPQSIVRYEAVSTLQYFLPLNYEDKDEAEVITSLLTSANSQTTFALRSVCIDALILAGPDPKKGPDPRVTQALMIRAGSGEPATQVRLKAIMALGIMGRPQDPTLNNQVQALLAAKGRGVGLHYRTIRIWSHVSLSLLTEKIDDKDLKEIVECLKDREAALRVQAVTALGALQDKARDHVGTLCDMVLGRRPEDDLSVLKAICSALSSMRNTGDRVKRTLIQMSEIDDAKKTDVTLAACQALAQLFTDDRDALDALEKAKQHKSFQDFHRNYVDKFVKDAKELKKNAKEKPKLDDKGIGGGVTQPKKK
jgi:HEAT repeat protein